MRNKDTYFVSALKKLDSSSMDKLGPIPESSRGEGSGGQTKKKKNITRGNKQFHPDLNRKTATKINISLACLTQGFPFVEHRRHQPIYTCRPYWKIITHAMNTGAALHHSKRTITIRTAKIRDKFYSKAFNYN